MRWTLVQTVKDGINLPRGKEIKHQYCTIETFKSDKEDALVIASNSKTLYNLKNFQISFAWKVISISGVSSEIDQKRNTSIWVLQAFRGTCSSTNEAEEVIEKLSEESKIKEDVPF